MDVEFDAIVVAGGRGSRLGGVDKASVDLHGEALVQRAFDAAKGAQHLVMVGETSAATPSGCLVTRENPPGSGPAAALVAGLTALDLAGATADWTLVLACDLPGATQAVRRLDRAINSALRDGTATDGVVLVDPEGRPQWVCGLYSRQALRRAASALGDAHGSSMRKLLGELDLVRARPRSHEWQDVDTWADHAQWEARLTEADGGTMADSIEAEEEWARWVDAAAAALDIDPAQVDIKLIHGLSKVVAHQVRRPLAPVSTYMVGIAIGMRLAAGEDVTAADRKALAKLVPTSMPDALDSTTEASSKTDSE